MADPYELLTPENIEVDYTEEELRTKGFTPEDIEKLGRLPVAAASEFFGEGVDTEAAQARIQEQIKAFHESVKEKPQPGAGSQRRF